MGVINKALILIIFTLAFESSKADWRSLPRSYPLPKIFEGNSPCHGLKKPLKKRLYQMRKEGHKLVLLLAGGSHYSLPKLRVNDELNGRIHLTINSYVEDLENYIQNKMSSATFADVKKQTRNCLQGDRLDPQLQDLSCTNSSNIIFTHVAFVILNEKIHPEPFMVHFYGDENYNFLKPAIRIETFDSYMKESNYNFCQVGVALLNKKSEDRVYDFLVNDYAKNLLAAGDKSYNILSNPWKTKTQNCNIWMSEVFASSFYLNKSEWSRANRITAKKILAKTDFRPVKVAMSDIQGTAGLLDLFFAGLNTTEGNINFEYGVADIVPARSITEWLARNGRFQSVEYIKGSLD